MGDTLVVMCFPCKHDNPLKFDPMKPMKLN